MGTPMMFWPSAMVLDTCTHLPYNVIPQEGPEENSAYEQLLSHLEEIAEEGQFVGLATNLCGLVHKESPLGASGLRLEMGSLQCRRD